MNSIVNSMNNLNELYNSNSLDDILTFYNYFLNTEKLIEWMRNRPKGTCYIKEDGTDSDVVVVIPTKNAMSRLANNCRSIYKGARLLFVESGDNNPYFNYAHNCNEGIKKALDFDPKWILLSNDDMLKIDEFSVLKSQLDKIDRSNTKVVYTQPSRYHSIPVCLSTSKLARNILFSFSRGRRNQIDLEQKYSINFFSSMDNFLWNRFFKCNLKHISIAAFSIFNSQYLREMNGSIFDETYINGGEDIDFSLKCHLENVSFAFIRYKIQDMMGTSLGGGYLRGLRDIMNYAYFNYKIRNNILRIQNNSLS